MIARTLWHTIYDQHALTAQTSFYLGETTAQDGTRAERRSPLPALHPGPNLSRHPQNVLAHAQSLRAAGRRSRRIT
jgi:hypothetical protein